MKHIHFEVKTDGFYGVYWKCKTPVDITIIAMLGNDPEGYMAKSCAKWLKKNGVNVHILNKLFNSENGISYSGCVKCQNHQKRNG